MRRNSISYFSNPKLAAYLQQANAVIFDMNGVIVDDEPVHLRCMRESLTIHGLIHPHEDWPERSIGRNDFEYLSEAFEGRVSRDVIISCIGRKHFLYGQYIEGNMRTLVRPGVLEFLDWLWEGGYRLAVATSSSRGGAEPVLGPKGLSIMNRFDVVVCGDEVKAAKPSPEIYLKAHRDLGNPTALVFEDAMLGVQASVAAGITTIAVPNESTTHQNFSAADMIISNFHPDATEIRGSPAHCEGD